MVNDESESGSADERPLRGIALLTRLSIIGIILFVVAGFFAYAGGWLTPGRLTPAKLMTAFREVNGAHPFRIVTQWRNPETSKLHVFRSDNLWFDPSEHIKTQTITVFIDQGNPKKYFVDVSFIPKLVD